MDVGGGMYLFLLYYFFFFFFLDAGLGIGPGRQLVLRGHSMVAKCGIDEMGEKQL